MNRIRALFVIISLVIFSSAQAGWKDLLNSAKEVAGGAGLTGGSALSSDQIVAGLKEALGQGTEQAVGLLGKDGGFLNDALVKIPLPKSLNTVAKGLKAVGQEGLVEEFVGTMNHAAEQAVPETAKIFSDAIQEMSLEDAKGILNGGETAATDYFREHSSEQLNQAIQPIVKQATEKAGVTSSYKKMTGNLGILNSLGGSDSLDLDSYVTNKAVAGLFVKIAEEEKRIRENPLARTTDLMKQVFGSIEK